MLLRRPLTALLAAATSAAAELTTSITLGIQPSQQLANPNMLPATTHATLTTFRDILTAPLSTANTFVFHNVTAGSYLVDVHSPTHGFVPLRVDVIPLATGSGDDVAAEKKLQVKAWETYRGNDWDNKGEEAATLTLGKTRAFEVRPLGQKVYFTERGSFSVMGILKNPMILMSLVSMVAFLGIPKLVENMDPEMKAEFEETQKSNPMGALMGGGGQPGANPMESFDMAGFLSGHNNKKPESGSNTGGSASEGGSRSGGGSSSSGGGKKRR